MSWISNELKIPTVAVYEFCAMTSLVMNLLIEAIKSASLSSRYFIYIAFYKAIKL